ncbi:MAG: FAD-containing oxidoreductase [Bradymonadaceae bacterium]|nr:FAD-containing oxidoreductase [Lujinxingiaceae bacterium]
MTATVTKTSSSAEPSDSAESRSMKNWIKPGLGVLLIAGIIGVVFGPSEAWLLATTEFIQNMGVTGALIFAGAYILGTIFFFPGSILTIGAGFLFGLLGGVVVVSVASTLGALAAFFLGRYVAQDVVRKKIKDYPRFNAIYRAVGNEGFKVILLTRLVPVIPFNFLNYAFGLTDASWRQYLAASWVGMTPGTIAYVYIGAVAGSLTQAIAADGPPNWMSYGLFALGGVAVVAATWLVTRRARQEFDKIVDEEARPEQKTGQIEVEHVVPRLEPADEFNDKLVKNTHPPGWSNPDPGEVYNFIAIGAGTAGLVAAAGAAILGARSAIIERKLMGGDCLVTGCVPSKALIRSSRAIHDARQLSAYGGLVEGEVTVDFGRVMARMRRLRADISEHDAATRFADMGVDVFFGDACFTGPNTIVVGGRELTFTKALIATGASPIIPPIDGLDEVDYLTSETIFSLTELPERLGIIGAGPIGSELAQAFARFGSSVFVLDQAERALSRSDSDGARIVQAALDRDGVHSIFCAKIEKVEAASPGSRSTKIIFEVDGELRDIEVDALLIAAGRRPNVANLGLENAGVRFDDKTGIEIDDRLRSSKRHIFAAGDCASKFQFTHVAEAQAKIALQNALVFGRKKATDLIIPRVTYTDPELAEVGLCEDEAIADGLEFDVIKYDFEDLDRAITDGETAGFAKVLLEKGKDRILGAAIVARNAGDMISEMTLAMNEGIGLARISSVIHPYPTQAEAIKKLADEYNRRRLKPWMKRWLERFFAWMR